MDESDIKIAIKNMNVWLDECHNDSDTVVMTANVLRSIRDNYCELLRCRDAIERLQKEHNKNFEKWKILAERTEKHYEKLYQEAKAIVKSEARKEVVDVVRKLFINAPMQGGSFLIKYEDADSFLKEMDGEGNV